MSLTSDYQDPISCSVYCVTTQFAYCIDDDIRVLIKREDKNEHKLCNSVMVLLAALYSRLLVPALTSGVSYIHSSSLTCSRRAPLSSFGYGGGSQQRAVTGIAFWPMGPM